MSQERAGIHLVRAKILPGPAIEMVTIGVRAIKLDTNSGSTSEMVAIGGPASDTQQVSSNQGWSTQHSRSMAAAGRRLLWDWLRGRRDFNQVDPDQPLEEGEQPIELVAFPETYDIGSKLTYAFGFWIPAHTMDFHRTAEITTEFRRNGCAILLVFAILLLLLEYFVIAPLLMENLANLTPAWRFSLVGSILMAVFARHGCYGLWSLADFLYCRNWVRDVIYNRTIIIKLPRNVMENLAIEIFFKVLMLTVTGDPLFMVLLVIGQLDTAWYYKLLIVLVTIIIMAFASGVANGFAMIKMTLMRAEFLFLDLEYKKAKEVYSKSLTTVSGFKSDAMKLALRQMYIELRPILMEYANMRNDYESHFGQNHPISTHLDTIIMTLLLATLFMKPSNLAKDILSHSNSIQVLWALIEALEIYAVAVLFKLCNHILGAWFFFNNASSLQTLYGDIEFNNRQLHNAVDQTQAEEERAGREPQGRDHWLDFDALCKLMEDAKYNYSFGRTYNERLIFDILGELTGLFVLLLTVIALKNGFSDTPAPVCPQSTVKVQCFGDDASFDFFS